MRALHLGNPFHQMIIPKPVIVVHAFGVFFAFLAMCCFAGVAAFQSHWKVGPCEYLFICRDLTLRVVLAGLTGFAIFVSIFSLLLSLFMLLVPVAYEKYDKMIRLARALQEVRVGFILSGTGVTLTFLLA